MRVRTVVLCVWILGAAGSTSATAQLPSPPQVGDAAPDFTLRGSDGRTYTLREFRGIRPVVIAWFPKAFAKV